MTGHPLSSSSIYNDPWHPLCSVYELDSPLGQPLSRSSLVFLCALAFVQKYPGDHGKGYGMKQQEATRIISYL